MIIREKSGSKASSIIVREILKQINRAIKSLDWRYKVKDSDLMEPPEKTMGDFAFPCFKLAKELGKRPNDIAKVLNKKIIQNDLILSAKNIDGYLNFYVNKKKFASVILSQVLKEGNKYGNSEIGKKQKVMLEFSSPNTNKPLHLGHLRNIAIGWSVARLLETVGFKVIKTSLLNDRGIHICKAMLGYKKWGKNKKPVIKTDHFVGQYYVLFNKKFEENPELQQELSKTLQKLENKDAETVALWKKLNRWAEKGFKETYLKLGISFDKVYRESKIYKKGKRIILEGFKKGVFEKDKEGGIIANLENYGLPNKVLLRGDGTSLYITQDIYLAKIKFEEFGLKKSIYCVGNEQDLYLKQLFKILKLLGYVWAKDCEHLSHGMVFLPEGKMKSREGKVVEADDIIFKIENLASQEISKREPMLSKLELSQRSLEIALGALKYYLLAVDPSKDVYFEPKKSISFIGKTGPYIQYSHARICSILRKVKRASFQKTNYSCLNSKEELELTMFLSKFPLIIEESALNYNPALLTQYLYKLAEMFNSFYEHFPVLQAEKETKKARLLLINCVKIILEKGLNLLGINSPEKM